METFAGKGHKQKDISRNIKLVPMDNNLHHGKYCVCAIRRSRANVMIPQQWGIVKVPMPNSRRKKAWAVGFPHTRFFTLTVYKPPPSLVSGSSYYLLTIGIGYNGFQLNDRHSYSGSRMQRNHAYMPKFAGDMAVSSASSWGHWRQHAGEVSSTFGCRSVRL